MIIFGAACLQCALSYSSSAFAQIPEGRGIDSQSAMYEPGPSSYLTVRGGDILDHLAVSFSAIIDHHRRPLKLETAKTDSTKGEAFLVDDWWGADFMWAFGFFDYIQLGMVMPVVFYQDGEGHNYFTESNEEELEQGDLAASAVRDLRLHLKGVFLRSSKDNKSDELYENGGFQMGVEAAFAFPTGDTDAYAGGRGYGIFPMLFGEYKIGMFSVAANAGARIRTEDVNFVNLNVGHQLAFGLALAGHFTDRRVIALLDSNALAGLMEEGQGVALEFMGGMGYIAGEDRDVMIKAGLGSGVSIGNVTAVPDIRMLIGIVYSPLAEEDW